MPIVYFYSMAVVLAVLVLLSVVNLVVGVLSIVTGRSYFPAWTRRLRRRTPASVEDERMLGMSLTLGAVFGLVMFMQIGLLVIFTTTGWPGPHTTATTVAMMTGLVVFLFVDLLLIGGSAAVGFRVRTVDGRPDRLLAEGEPGAPST
jgi:hypothetical protein